MDSSFECLLQKKKHLCSFVWMSQAHVMNIWGVLTAHGTWHRKRIKIHFSSRSLKHQRQKEYWSDLFWDQSGSTSSTATWREDENLQVMPELGDYFELCPETRNFGTYIRKRFFPMKTVKHWQSYPDSLSIPEPVACPFLKFIKTTKIKPWAAWSHLTESSRGPYQPESSCDPNQTPMSLLSGHTSSFTTPALFQHPNTPRNGSFLQGIFCDIQNWKAGHNECVCSVSKWNIFS